MERNAFGATGWKVRDPAAPGSPTSGSSIRAEELRLEREMILSHAVMVRMAARELREQAGEARWYARRFREWKHELVSEMRSLLEWARGMGSRSANLPLVSCETPSGVIVEGKMNDAQMRRIREESIRTRENARQLLETARQRLQEIQRTTQEAIEETRELLNSASQH